MRGPVAPILKAAPVASTTSATLAPLVVFPAEVLAADAFSRFAKEGVMNEKTGADYRKHILAPGDSRSASDIYREFMGRDPNPDALLRKQGLISES